MLQFYKNFNYSFNVRNFSFNFTYDFDIRDTAINAESFYEVCGE